jgi:hypothetical protein
VPVVTSTLLAVLLKFKPKLKKNGRDRSNGGARQNVVDFITRCRLGKCIRSCRN